MRARLAALLVISAAAALSGCGDDPGETLDHGAGHNDELSEARAELRAELEEAHAELDELSEELSTTEAELGDVERELAEARAELDDQRQPDGEGDDGDAVVDREDAIADALNAVGSTGPDPAGMLEAQLHALTPQDEPAAEPTPWSPSEHPAVDSHIGGHALTPEAAARDLADEVFPGHTGQDRWATTVRVEHDDNTTVATALTWGLKDDAAAGHDLRLHLDAAEQGWVVTDVEERHWCRRGVTDDNLCR